MQKKEQIIKDTFKFTSARYISQGIGFFTALAMRRFLGPFYMGIWSLLKVLLGYVAYLFLGVDKGVANVIPLYAGQGDAKEEEEAKNVSFSFTLLVCVLTGIALLVAAFVLRHKYPKEVITGLCALSAYVILVNLCAFYQIILRTKHNFSVLSRSIIFEAAVNLVLVLFLVSNFKIYGLYATVILVAVLNLIFMHHLAGYRFNFTFKMEKISGLIKVGFPITVVSLLQWALASLDRIMIANMIGVTFVGYYSIPIMAKSYVGQLSGFGTVLYPRIMEAYGKNPSVEDIKRYVLVPPVVNAYLLPAFLGLIFIIVPLLVVKVLPKFVPGILAMQILLLEMFFASCRDQAFHFLVALKKQTKVVPLVIVAILLNIAGNYWLIKKGYGIYGVAWATSVVTFLSFVAIQGYAMIHFAKAQEIILFVGKIVLPLVYTVAVVLLLQKYVVVRNVYVEAGVKSALLMVFSFPLFYYINRKTRIISMIFEMLKTKFVRSGVIR